MPKVRKLEVRHKGQTVEANLTVRADGFFYVRNPDPEKTGRRDEIKAKTADEAEVAWVKAVREFLDKSKTTRKVILVEFDSNHRRGGTRCFFTKDQTGLILLAAIAEETVVTVGEERSVTFREWPEFVGLHSPETPIPVGFRIRGVEHAPFHEDRLTVVPWTEANEALVVRACQGIQAVVDMLDRVTATPEALMTAAAAGLTFTAEENPTE